MKKFKYMFFWLLTLLSCLLTSCSSSKIVISNNADISKYKYVIFGQETSGDRELDDIVMIVQNLIADTDLIVINPQDIVYFDGILSPSINVKSEKWDGGHTYITITFYDYKANQSIAVVKSSGIGMSISHDQSIALGAIKKKINKLFNKIK